LGSTVESLLNAGVIFPSRARDNLHQKSKSIRGWTLGDFWEQSTWPRDSSGSAQIRFGLPVVEDPNLDEEPLLAEPPSRRVGATKSLYEQFDFGAKEDYLEEAPPPPVQENPFVFQVAGVQGVRTEIMEEELDCILFLSAKFCKTCKAINPQYTRMARMGKESSRSIVFAKAETSGRWGKELGRYFGVEAVPAFLMFRKGQRFGSPLSVSKLPSRKIDRALELLESGAPWDPDVLREDEKQP
jgi:thiol-disulfide isomerase/thioredoxin